MPGVLTLLARYFAASFIVLCSHADVWPEHAEYSLGLLDGTDGFRVTAEASLGRLGYSVCGAGDVNNDGFTDVIIGEAPEYSSIAGVAYIIFGSETFSFIDMDVSTLDGSNGFRVEGTDAGDFAGTSVAGAGDVNGDGFDDLVVGAWGASSGAGEILVVFGSATLPAVVVASDLDGSTGFVIRGGATSDAAGFSVAAAGDVNNDGAADILIGAHKADPFGSMSGEAYIVFGSLAWTKGFVDLGSLGLSGLTFQGQSRREYAGYSVAGAGDVNDDGYSDVVISAYGADEAYVFYGAPIFTSTTYALGSFADNDGFVISAGNNGDVLIVSGAGDMNDDGYGDIAIGNSLADPSSRNSAGATFIVFGGGTIESPLNLLTDLDGNNGFVLEGASSGDLSGTSVSAAGDINQDGYGDIIVGAPGVGSNAGSAYVVFGREVFSASYTLGSIGPEGSFVLIAPTDNGYGGFSVGGTGDMNQDGFPDLVIGAYDSGTAGEVFVVFPHLTGTPPPTPSPTPAPTGPTSSPLPVFGTPAPTINFLVNGVVGVGTVYESTGVFVRVDELGGQVSLGANRWLDQDTMVSFSLEGLHEKNAEGGLVGLGANIPHVIKGGGLVYEVSATTNTTVGGLAAQQSIMTTAILDGETSISISMDVFEEGGVITSGDERMTVVPGDLKISFSLYDWPFCDPTTAPTRANQKAPPTVCPLGLMNYETGTYLDATLVVQGPSSSMPVLREEGIENNEVGNGMAYDMFGGSADATLVMSEWVETADYGWTKAEEVSLSESSFTVRFPASSGSLSYDPTFELVLTPESDKTDFWRTMWFKVLVVVAGALIIICLIGFIARRRRQVTKEKVSPIFEGVAPAVGSDGGANERKRKSAVEACMKAVFCCCPNRGKRVTLQDSSKKTAEPKGDQRHIGFPGLPMGPTGPSPTSLRRWRRKDNSVANEGTAGTKAVATGGREHSGMTVGDEIAKAPSEGAAARSSDGIQGLGVRDAAGGSAAEPGTPATEEAVPNWLVEVGGPAAGGGANENIAHDESYYGQEGYEGYEGYEGCGYDTYGYDGYGYDGYGYDARCNAQESGAAGAADAAGAAGAAAVVGAVSRVSAVGAAGAAKGNNTSQCTPPPGLSCTINAASTVDAFNEQEDEEGGAATPAAKSSATRLPPIDGSVTGGGAFRGC